MNSIHRVPMRKFLIAFAAALDARRVQRRWRVRAHAPGSRARCAVHAQLEQAEDQQQATPIEQAIWSRWADSGSPTVNILLERANAAEDAGDAELAERFLDQASDLGARLC
jgi:hypothetical protein